MSNQQELKAKIEQKGAIRLSDLRQPHNPVFKKSEDEKKLLKKLKKDFKTLQK